MTISSRLNALATRVSAEIKSLRTLINGNAATLANLTTNNKTDLVAAINEINAKPTGVGIDDASTATTTVWSSSKTNSSINAAVASIVQSSPAALDTLQELAAALGGDANFATTTATALGNRVRTDAAQSLSAGQQQQARNNIGAMDAALIGDPDADFVAVFEAGLL
jgi:hypothetical protein